VSDFSLFGIHDVKGSRRYQVGTLQDKTKFHTTYVDTFIRRGAQLKKTQGLYLYLYLYFSLTIFINSNNSSLFRNSFLYFSVTHLVYKTLNVIQLC